MLSNMRKGLTPGVLAFCAIIFLADVTTGVVAPTFSLFARSLGVSLAVLGFLSTAGGVSQMLISLPCGMLSDRIGRPQVLLSGLAVFVVALLAMASAQGLPLLFVSRILMGVAAIATFQIGAAYLGDITEPGQRPFAFGLSTTAMGTGFTVGPLLGSQLAQRGGARVAYLAGAACAIASLAIAGRIDVRRPRTRLRSASRSGFRNVRAVLAHRGLMLVSFGNLLMSFAFAGAIMTFFPIYGAQANLSQAAVGTMFAVRALVSTLGRLPNGTIARAFGNQSVMLAALGLDVLVMLGIAWTGRAGWLLLLLALDGLAYGAYLVSGQTFVADHTRVENRGAAVGIYSTAASIGSTVGPLALGLVAASWGVARVFTVSGSALAVGLVFSLLGLLVPRRRDPTLQVSVAPPNDDGESEGEASLTGSARPGRRGI